MTRFGFSVRFLGSAGIGIIFTLTFLSGLGLAQEPAPGVLYMTAAAASTSSSQSCGAKTDYTLVQEAPTGTASKKAYFPEVTFACDFFFIYEVSEPFKLSDSAAVKLWLGCDLAANNVASPATVEFRFYLHKNTQQLSESVHQTTRACTGTPIAYSFQLGTGDAEFAPGDKVRLRVLSFWVSTGQGNVKNLHFLVGSATHPSSISALGIPAAGAAAPAVAAADLIVELPAQLTAEDGIAMGSGSVTNNASADDEVSFGVEALPDGMSGEVRIDGNASTNATLAAGAKREFGLVVSGATQPGSYNITLNVTSKLGFANAYPIELIVPEPQSNATTESPLITASAGAGADVKEGDDNKSTPGPTFLVVVAGVAICLACLRFRRR